MTSDNNTRTFRRIEWHTPHGLYSKIRPVLLKITKDKKQKNKKQKKILKEEESTEEGDGDEEDKEKED